MLAEQLLGLLDSRGGGTDGRACGQAELEKQLGTLGQGEELLLDVTEPDDRAGENPDRRGDHG